MKNKISIFTYFIISFMFADGEELRTMKNVNMEKIMSFDEPYDTFLKIRLLCILKKKNDNDLQLAIHVLEEDIFRKIAYLNYITTLEGVDSSYANRALSKISVGIREGYIKRNKDEANEGSIIDIKNNISEKITDIINSHKIKKEDDAEFSLWFEKYGVK